MSKKQIYLAYLVVPLSMILTSTAGADSIG
jgi:hypothetical protein